MNSRIKIQLGSLLFNYEHPVRQTFACMDIAEEELALRGMSKRKGVFMLLVPPKRIVDKVEHLYRAHVRELLSRLQKNEDTAPLTDADIVEAAGHTPLRGHIVQAAERLIRKCIPDEMIQMLPAMEERHSEEVTEFIENHRRSRRERKAT